MLCERIDGNKFPPKKRRWLEWEEEPGWYLSVLAPVLGAAQKGRMLRWPLRTGDSTSGQER